VQRALGALPDRCGGDPTTVYQLAGASCVGRAPTAGATYLGLGAEVPAASFVKMTTTSEPRDARLAATVLVGEDGSREVTGVTDIARAMPCFAFRSGTGKSFCEPREAAFLVGDYGDAGCATPAGRYAVTYQLRCDHPPDMVIDFQNEPILFERGAKVTSLFTRPSGTCIAEPIPTNSDFYLAGAPVAIASLVQLAETQEGSGRIQLRQMRSPLGGLAGSFGYYDTQVALPCDRRTASDGIERCIPDGEGANYFIDASCRSPVVDRAPSGPPLTPGTYVTANQPVGTGVYLSAAKIAPPAMLYQLTGNGCEASGAVPMVDYYATSVVAPTSLVPITVVVE
jgi:hypothetical protein